MKKLVLLAAIVLAAFTLKAQNVNVQETSIKMTKKVQVSGYSVSMTSVDAITIETAIKNKFEKDYKMKGSKGDGGFRAYMGQPFAVFGTANYDIYWKVEEMGKKNNATIDIMMIVSSGNMNAITSQNNPETAAKIKIFLSDIVRYVKEYALNSQLETLNSQLEKLNNDKKSILEKQAKSEKDVEDLQKKIDKANNDIETYQKQAKEKDDSIKELEDQISALRKQF